MDFPAFGDADAYAVFGQHCAAYLSGSEPSRAGCYNAIRPIGINFYHAIPYLLTKDDLVARYMALLMNSLCLFLLLCSCMKLMGASTAQERTSRIIDSAWACVIAPLVGILAIGFVPVRLSDLPSASFFLAGLAILRKEPFRTDPLRLAIAGLFCGTAVLFRQNYAVPMFFLVVTWCVLLRPRSLSGYKPVLLYLAGCSVVLIQMLWVFQHSGIFWLYEPAGLKFYAAAHQQPYVELIAYTQPTDGAYASRLSSHVSEFHFWLIRLYEGVAKFYWTPYSGAPPLHTSPEVLNVTGRRLARAYGLFASLAGAAAGSLLFKSKWLSILLVSSFFHALFIAMTNQTENRHYLYYKLVLLICAASVARQVLSDLFDKVRELVRARSLRNPIQPVKPA